MAITQEGCSLVELFFESCELLFQVCDLLLKVCNVVAKCGDFLFQMSDPFRVEGRGSEWRVRNRLCIPLFHVGGQEMCVASLLGAGLPGKNFDEGRLALHEMLQAGLHGAQVV